MTERCLDCSAAVLAEAETRRRRPRLRRYGHRRGECSVSGVRGRPQATKVGEIGTSVHHRIFRPQGRLRPGFRRARSKLPTTGHLPVSLPRPCVTGAGRTEISSGRRKRTENFGGSFGCADEWADRPRWTSSGSVFGPSKHRSSKKANGAWRVISKYSEKPESAH